jgi:hypothetical protein
VQFQRKQGHCFRQELRNNNKPDTFNDLSAIERTPGQNGHVALIMAGVAVLLTVLFVAGPVFAHASEQGFVLLLPTDIYISFGVAAVALTVLLLAILPGATTTRLFASKAFPGSKLQGLQTVTSLVSLTLLATLVMIGWLGPRDPLVNLLPLIIWTAWWIGFVVLQGVIGDMWHWFNPWTGLYRLTRESFDLTPRLVLPDRVGSWPAVLAFLAFMAFALADLAPDDPARLAVFVSGYWVYTLIGMLLFGDVWLDRGECFTVLLRHFGALGVIQGGVGTLQASIPGRPLIKAKALSISGGVFVLLILGSGTFDGLNETFWWLQQIGINPLAFPGRSAVVGPTLAGLVGANVLLVAAFTGTLYLGLWLINERDRMAEAFGRLVRSILPIALAYHAAHFLTALLVNGQYTIAAISDPWNRGVDLLGLGDFRVTTGFFNSRDTVEIIWLTQAGIIVVGHILAVLIAHAIAIDMFRETKKATLSQVPMAAFMILYTLIGLALLASPRGA